MRRSAPNVARASQSMSSPVVSHRSIDKKGARHQRRCMLRVDDKLLKRLELYFGDKQANLALFSATLKMTLMRREDILADLETTLFKAQALARRDRSLA